MDNPLNIAVLGNPNKGKSSLVSSLAYDDNIKVSSFSGETVVSTAYNLIINNKIIYRLFDTPGFNNEDELLDFIEQCEERYDNKIDILKKFLSIHLLKDEYAKEVEIVKVLLNKPIIFFVIDSSSRYQRDYETQLEFIKWLDFPTIAIYNQISTENYKNEWEDKISEYIKTSIEVNFFDINLNKKLLLLKEALKLKISKEQKDFLNKAIEVLDTDYSLRVEKSINEIIFWLKEALSLKKNFTIPKINIKNKTNEEFLEEYKEEYFLELTQKEKLCQKRVENIWGFRHLDTKLDDTNLFNFPLESTQSIEIFGISSKNIKVLTTLIGATTGGSLGSSIDFLGGMGLGTTLGGLLGAVTGLYSSTFIEEIIDVKTSSIGKNISIYLGPIKDMNLIISIIVRAIIHIKSIKNRSHARRNILELSNLENLGEEIFKNTSERKEILRLVNKLNEDGKYEDEFKNILENKILQ